MTPDDLRGAQALGAGVDERLEHLSILDAVDKGNLEGAESLMREHLKKTGGL